MAQVKPKSVKPDTTKIKTPYKVSSKELGSPKVFKQGSQYMSKPNSDTTVQKVKHNLNDVQKSLNKRNMERVSSGQKPISKDEVFGTGRKDVRESKKGRNLKK